MSTRRRSHSQHRLASRRNGATLVEMAFAAPVLFVMVIGLIQFGYLFMVQHLIQNTARQACRTATIAGNTNNSVLDAVSQSLQAQGIRGATTTILVNNAAGDITQTTSGDNIGVQITVPVSSVSMVPNAYSSGQLTSYFTRRRD
jgi:Flp pilus assembly protein TadG